MQTESADIWVRDGAHIYLSALENHRIVREIQKPYGIVTIRYI